MAKILQMFFVLLMECFFAGCSSSKMSYVSASSHIKEKCEIRSIAMNPSGGLLGDAIAMNLAARGYHVYDTQQSSSLFARLNMNELEVSSNQDYEKLRKNGVDAYLFVRSSAGSDGLPQDATVRLNRTTDGKLLLGITWSNGWGGQEGSISDRSMRKNLAEAADQITKGLVKGLPCLANSSNETVLEDLATVGMEVVIYE